MPELTSQKMDALYLYLVSICELNEGGYFNLCWSSSGSFKHIDFMFVDGGVWPIFYERYCGEEIARINLGLFEEPIQIEELLKVLRHGRG